jgi:hypothetical protein
MVGEKMVMINEAEYIDKGAKIAKCAAILGMLAMHQEVEVIKITYIADVLTSQAVAELIEDAVVIEDFDTLVVFLTGSLVFVLGYIVTFLLFTLILDLSIFLYWVSLPTLGFETGTLGLTSLGIALSIFWLSIVFFSKIIVAYLCGSLFFKRFLPKFAHHRVWPFLSGVILYPLLTSIPTGVGW